MRRRVFNSKGSITRWFAPKRSYTKGLVSGQEAVTDLKSENEESQQLVQAGGIENTAGGQRPSGEGKRDGGDIKVPVRKPLPLSPLVDPTYQAAKQKHTQRKAAPSKEPSPFQQQLAKNPYAQALATPIRMCSLTRIALPSFFFQDFEMIAHPSTQERWYLPRSLTSPYSASPTEAITIPDVAQPNGIKRGPKVYTLSRAALIKGIRTPKSGYTDGEQRFHADTARLYKSFRATKIRWREDIDTFILDMMRRRVLQGLKYLSGRQKGYLVGCPNWDYAKGTKQVGAFIWLGPEVRGMDDRENKAVEQEIEMEAAQKVETILQADGVAANRQDETTVNEKDGTATRDEMEATHGESSSLIPGEFATVDVGKEVRSKIPAYNLQLLLGESYIRDLREHTSPTMVFNKEVVAIKHRNATIDIQLRLWKLQGYIAEHKPVDNE